VIEAVQLGRTFGERDVLRGLDLDIPRGAFLLVTGGNGSGKSTLLSLLAGLLAPTAGRLTVGARRGEIGYVGHEPLVYEELTALENLELFGSLYRVADRRERPRLLLERYDLWEARNERVAAYSRGMKQRLALCRALLHEPELVLLDEPYAGLDAVGAELLDDELARLCGARTLVVSSHLPERIEHLATLRLAL
jgi:ABC-type multidrug transport system ATPase subunit